MMKQHWKMSDTRAAETAAFSGERKAGCKPALRRIVNFYGAPIFNRLSTWQTRDTRDELKILSEE